MIEGQNELGPSLKNVTFEPVFNKFFLSKNSLNIKKIQNILSSGEKITLEPFINIFI